MSGSRLLNPILAVVVSVLLAAGILALAISRETPVGALRGTVVAQESGAPIDVWVSIRQAEKGDGYRNYFHTKAVNGRFTFRRVPTGGYTLELRSNYRHSPPIKVSIEEGKTETINIELAPGPPRLDLYVHQHIFTPDERAQVTCQGYIESGALSVQIHKVDLDAFLVRYGGNLHTLTGAAPRYGYLRGRPVVDLSTRPALSLGITFFHRTGLTSYP